MIRPVPAAGAAAQALADAGLVVSCEHGGNRIPSAYLMWFREDQALLQTHRGYDPGALSMARSLAVAFRAPLVASVISRLLVDLNRSIGHRQLHMSTIPQRPTEIRERILERYYVPYRSQAEALVNRAIASCGRVIHISSHSFTPELDGQVRHADIGLLYDPSRPGERALCTRWQSVLSACAPNLLVRRNYPYAGRNDGLTRWFRRRLSTDRYVGVELELNQKLCAGPAEQWWALRAAIIHSLRQALNAEGRPGDRGQSMTSANHHAPAENAASFDRIQL